ncbi:hypothetical protein AzCIB_1639 [Azoarcus sp. CIB]|uniref:hypothetical protein n=1 Tax=Aromatoleum sp. (strain CIB) TaxID=198107 RepID=UPI0006A2FC8A|nr:hypothetical protein [Azoarcus sp. CIB]AKU11540.1 hypothetical protein AzCIB_1639 [Azoarcus sp. CIB]MBD5803866.1 hypothetical protein [Azoarcus sp. Aa7]
MPDWVFQILTAGGGALAVYGGIRYDLGQLREKAENAARSAEKAHARLDGLMGAHRAA